MEEIGRKLCQFTVTFLVTDGYLFDNRWPHFFENVNKLWTTKIFGNFGRKIQKNRSKKNEFFVK